MKAGSLALLACFIYTNHPSTYNPFDITLNQSAIHKSPNKHHQQSQNAFIRSS